MQSLFTVGLFSVVLIITTTASKTSLDAQQTALNSQVTKEYQAAYIYDQLANHFSKASVGLLGFAKFFRQEASEERGHAEKLADFMVKKRMTVTMGEVNLSEYTNDISNLKSGLDGLRIALRVEEKNSKSILNLSRQFEGELDDHNVVNFLDDYIQEQVESEYNLHTLIKRLKDSNNEILEFMLDQEFLK